MYRQFRLFSATAIWIASLTQSPGYADSASLSCSARMGDKGPILSS